MSTLGERLEGLIAKWPHQAELVRPAQGLVETDDGVVFDAGYHVCSIDCRRCQVEKLLAAAPSLHKEEVNMPRDPRDKQESGAHRADSESTSAFDAKAWLAKEYPDWIMDVKPYELELIERAYNSGRAALHKEGAGGAPSGYDLAKASSAMRGTVWLWDDERDVFVNPTFHDWEAMAAALAAPVAPLDPAEEYLLSPDTSKAKLLAAATDAPKETPKWECTCKGRFNKPAIWHADDDCPIHGEKSDATTKLWRISQAVKLHSQNDLAGLRQFYDYVKGVVGGQ